MSKFSLRIQPEERSSHLYAALTTLSTMLLIALCISFGYLHLQKLQFLSIQSPSMVPVLPKGALVIVDPVPVSSVHTGDIVTFINPKNQQQTITHRVVAIDSKRTIIQTKGDANPVADTPVSGHQLIGRVTHAIPYAGTAVDVIRQPIGLAIIVYLPALLIIISEMRRLATYYQTQKVYRLRQRQANLVIYPGSKTAIALQSCLVAVLAVPLVAMNVSAALSSTASLTGSTVATAPIAASYTVCQFPSDNSLTSYAPVDALLPHLEKPPLTLDKPILPGTYKITAISRDNHLIHPNAPNQPDERWYAQLYSANSTAPAYATGITDDIPNNTDEVTTILNTSITFTSTITGIRYAHHAWLTGLEKVQFGNRRFDDLSETEKRQVIWNSVHPGCITFERQSSTSLPPARQ
jgi:signal peptidase I